jgi:pimeloyl-ACP methyl ester carboxylesterase
MRSSLKLRGAKLRTVLVTVAAAALAAVAAVIPSQTGAAASHASHAPRGAHPAPKPTIVLEHGAWADGSSWAGVIRRLQNDGYTVVAPPNPLRGLASDAATLADFLATIHGPIVLAGHSYGGAVITNAATGNPNVKALVFVDAFIPDQGETVFGLNAAQPGSCIGGDPAKTFNFVPYPGAPAGDVDLYLQTAPNPPYLGFHECFANDLPASQAAVLAATQRPIAFSAGSAPSGAPAWKTIPSWALIGTIDHVIPPAELLFMANRAHARITEIRASHLSLISHPAAVERVIISAARSTS